jgi:CPA1 family monovalent cation:H+ antiporter
VWRYADYLITSLVFILIGFELTAVLKQSALEPGLVRLSVMVIGALVALRLVWVFPAAFLARPLRGREADSTPFSRRESLVVGWAGMRGVVTVATALALPIATDAGEAFPERAAIVVIGLSTVLVTLVIQGLTLVPLVRVLHVGVASGVRREVATLRRKAAAAALGAISASAEREQTPEVVVHAARLHYEGYLAAKDAAEAVRGHVDGSDEASAEALEALLRRAAEVERSMVLESRRRGEVSAEAADEVLADVEGRALRDID